MKRSNFSIIIIVSLMFIGCNFSVGGQKDFNTGLSFKFNGFRVKDVYLVDSSMQKLTNNTVIENNRVGIIVSGIYGFTPINEKVFPGFTIDIKTKDGKPLLDVAPQDLFENNAGFSPTDASILMGSIKIMSPMKQGETYHLIAHVWDKNNIKNTVDANVDVVVK